MRTILTAAVAMTLLNCGVLLAGDHFRRLRIDVGRFSPYAQGIIVDVRRNDHGTGVSVDVGRRFGRRGVHVDVNTGPPIIEPIPSGSNVQQNPPTLIHPPAVGHEAGREYVPPKPAPPAGNAPPVGDAPGNTTTRSATQNYLGIVIKPLPEVLAVQFSERLDKGHGLLVARIQPNSPAEKSGLKQHDILVTYGEMKLARPNQLIALVVADEPGATANLGVIRGAKQMQVAVTLGRRPVRRPAVVIRNRVDFGTDRLLFAPNAAVGGPVFAPPAGVPLGIRVHHVKANYRVVSADVDTTDGRTYRARVTVAERHGKLYELHAAGTKADVRWQLIDQLLGLP